MITLSSRTSTGDVALVGQGEVYDQTNHILVSSDTNPVETGRSEPVVEIVTVETVGPATIRVGANQDQA